jgi:hypothetical protein
MVASVGKTFGICQFLLFIAALFVACVWQFATPIEYTGDSGTYMSVARMLTGLPPDDMPFIFRPSGYPIFLVLTGVPVLRTFHVLMFVQTLLAASIPVFIYRLLQSAGHRIALTGAVIALLSATATIHCSKVMTEGLFTFLGFLELTVAASILARSEDSRSRFYQFALVGFAQTLVRPIAGPIFWVTLIILMAIKRSQWLNALRAGLLFVGLASGLLIVDDILLSRGVGFSPQLAPRNLTASRFLETYFDIWAQRVRAPDPNDTSTIQKQKRPAMERVRSIVLEALAKNTEWQIESNRFPYAYFGQFSGRPEALVDHIFLEPNQIYAAYILETLNSSLSGSENHKMLEDVAAEGGNGYIRHWLKLVTRDPLQLFLGPLRTSGPAEFWQDYGQIRNFIYDPKMRTDTSRPSIIAVENGPATRFMLTTLTSYLRDNPQSWADMEPAALFRPFDQNPDRLVAAMLADPNQTYTWFMTVTLWNQMGYASMSSLLARVAMEARANHVMARALLFWDNLVMILAGPGFVDYDTGFRQSKITYDEVYDYYAPNTLPQRLISEIERSRPSHFATKLRDPIIWMYRAFYFSKPMFFVIMLIGVGVLLATGASLSLPLVLVTSYLITCGIYAVLFTSVSRYTDPTILIPIVVTLLAVPRLRNIWQPQSMKRA